MHGSPLSTPTRELCISYHISGYQIGKPTRPSLIDPASLSISSWMIEQIEMIKFRMIVFLQIIEGVLKGSGKGSDVVSYFLRQVVPNRCDTVVEVTLT